MLKVHLVCENEWIPCLTGEVLLQLTHTERDIQANCHHRPPRVNHDDG